MPEFPRVIGEQPLATLNMYHVCLEAPQCMLMSKRVRFCFALRSVRYIESAR